MWGGGGSCWVSHTPVSFVLRLTQPPFFFYQSPITGVAVGVTVVGAAPVIRPVPRFYIIGGYSSVTIPGMVAQLPPVEHMVVGGRDSKVGATYAPTLAPNVIGNDSAYVGIYRRLTPGSQLTLVGRRSVSTDRLGVNEVVGKVSV